MPVPAGMPDAAVMAPAGRSTCTGSPRRPDRRRRRTSRERLRRARRRAPVPGLQPAGFRDADDDANARSARRERLAARRGAGDAHRVEPGRHAGDSRGRALRPAQIDRLVLLAPAVMFAKPGHHLLPPERIEEWRRPGPLPFFHYADNDERDAEFRVLRGQPPLRSRSTRAFAQPALIFQGLRDTSVDPRTVEAFARTRPNVTLSLLDDDHQLIASLPRIWEGVARVSGVDRVRRARLALVVALRVIAAGPAVGLVGSPAWPALAPQQRADRPAPHRAAGRLRASPAAATPSRPCRSKPTSPACSPARRRAKARPAALEALAIAIRTFALANPDRHRADGFDLCDQTHCQVVRDGHRRDRTRRRRRRPARCCCANGALASVFYSASCGGRTEMPSNVWPGADDPPYLPSRDDDACEGAPAWTAEIRPARSAARVARPPDFAATGCATCGSRRATAPAASRACARRPDARRDLRAGSARGRRPDARLAAHQEHGVRAAAWRRNGYRFTGHGFGHGVGMCVIGSAQPRGARDDAQTAILRTYFPG